MCGRYALDVNADELLAQFDAYNIKVSEPSARFTPSYNVGPTHKAPVYHSNSLCMMIWGLIPYWTKDLSKAQPYKTFNARLESLLTSKMWKLPCEYRRCVVPISGYYEWKRLPSGKKVPYLVRRIDGNVMLLAGMYDEVKKEDGSNVLSYTIVTGPAPDGLNWLHERMPVVLKPNTKEWELWMNDEKHTWNADELYKVLETTFDSKEVYSYRVSTDVGKITNNEKYLVEPLKEGIASFFKGQKREKEKIIDVPQSTVALKREEETIIKKENEITPSVQGSTPMKRDVVSLLMSSPKRKNQGHDNMR
ncbi:putative peptide hydrolase Ecym_6101 [Eremothecium cymbalariae DBVPG|uniref:Abasic site processing protein n=1 Tax=Eremothecium cymbalariae (strain CBS 270.75 / DBVPG 7215 / KCTC 17166 / NRRL Y-17582) TaxID=931890 RepID=G8JV17_ERECY|nr:hypothetical protein Ecym_6101 [Eremothecium cymbalariae DBVPG\